MSALRPTARAPIEFADVRPDALVVEAEYHRLLGYPRRQVPSERAVELASWARRFYEEHGRPWRYAREVDLDVADDALRLDGAPFPSAGLLAHLQRAEAQRAILVAVSAGPEMEAEARRCWEAGKPDEYFFLETYGSAVVEHLMATASARVCDAAAGNGLLAVPPYSPGYAGWDVAEQGRLFELITRGATVALPGPLDVLATGMLRPKKSQLAIIGLTARTAEALAALRQVACVNCSFSPCAYRRAPYRHRPESSAPVAVPAAAANAAGANYTVNRRALRKWAQERVQLASRADGTLVATFRFDGTTCSNLGRPLAFDYFVTLGAAEQGRPILGADCRPAPGDEGHRFMCAYLSDGPGLLRAIAAEQPLLGRPLDDVLTWTRATAPSGCHCDAASRTHKWGLALEAIHFALQQTPGPISP